MMNEIINQSLEWRYAVKKFDSNQKIKDADWSLLEKSLLLSPSSYGLQPWKFLVLQNPELREKLKAVSWNQSQVTDCSHYVVFLVKESMDESYVRSFISRMAEVRGVEPSTLEGYAKVITGDVIHGPRAKVAGPWMERQSYIAMGFLMETAAMLKIDSCPMEGLDPNAYDEILNLKGSGYKTIASVALGFRSSDDRYQSAKKVRFPKDQIIQFVK